MLILHARRGRLADQCPVVVRILLLGHAAAQRQERLDGEHQAVIDAPAFGLVGPGGDFARLVMQAIADAVAGQVADQRIAALLGEDANGIADIGQAARRT